MDYYLENNLKLESSFNRVAAMRNGKIVIELPLGSVEDLNQVQLSQSGVCSRTDAGNCDIEQSWNLEVSAGYAERLTNISQRGSLHQTLIEADGVEANTRLVQQIGIEGMGPVHDRVSYGLVGALSSAGCTEKAAAKGRIAQVHLRPAPKYMVFVRDAVIDFQIALVGINGVAGIEEKVVPATDTVNLRKRIVL